MRVRARAAAFALLSALIVLCLSSLLIPAFGTQHGRNSNTIRGLYSQPANSVEVLFLGTSSMLAGISPVDLYRETGAVSYNCATRVQPCLASYYLMEEAYRLNPETLATVVVDPVMAIEPYELEERSVRTKESILLMDASAVKLRALWEASRFYGDFNFVDNLLPAFGYHARWEDLSDADYSYFALGDQSLDFSAHGYFARYGSNKSAEQAASWAVRDDLIASRDYDDATLDAAFGDEAPFLGRMADFCDEHGIRLVFMKMPRYEWGDLEHDAAQKLADELGAEFVDLNMPEHANALGLDFRTDLVDFKHANALGAKKMTAYVGRLMSEFGWTGGSRASLDAGNSAPVVADGAFTQADFDVRDRELQDAELFACEDLTAYLGLLSRERYTAFVATQGKDIDLSDDVREAFQALQMGTASNLAPGQYYVGVVESGKGLRGFSVEDPSLATYGATFDGKRLIVGEHPMQRGASFGAPFRLSAGKEASMTFQEVERCVQGDGINIVVYDHETGELIDSSCFSLSAPFKRTDDGIPTPS